MEELKDERSQLKRRVTVLGSRVTRAVNKDLSTASIRSIFSELEETYLDFLDKDEEYRDAVEADGNLVEEYATVNGLNLDDYTSSVDNTYQQVKTLYEGHMKSKRKKGKRMDITSSESSDSDSEGKRDEDFEDAAGSQHGEEQHEGTPITTTEGETTVPVSQNPPTHFTSSQSSMPSSNTGNYPFPSFMPSMYHPAYQQYLSSFPINPGTVMSTGASAFPYSSQMHFNPSQAYPTYTTTPSGVPPFSSAPSSFIPPNSSTAPTSMPLYSSGPLFPSMPQQVKVKAAELPHFSGLRKDWPQFKSMWPKLAIPAFSSKELLALELQRCIRGTDAEKKVEHISITGPQSFDDIWECLSQHYDDEAAAVNSILKDLSTLKLVKSDDYRGLVEHVNRIEGCATQLMTLSQMGSLSMREVDNLAGLLPETVKKDWHKRYHQLSSADKILPFSSYVTFLKEERRSVIRLADQQPAAATQKGRNQVTSHNTKSKGKKNPKCAVHRTDGTQHTTESCTAFIQMDREAKLKLLREVNGCYKCFGYHPRGRCPYKETCGKCGRIGHKTVLCLTTSNYTSGNSSNPPVPAPSNEPVKSKSHASQTKGKGIYAIYSVPVVGSRKNSCVFADDGNDTTFITNEAARKFGARKLNTYLLDVLTTGGIETEYESCEYELDLISRSGKIYTIQCFGLERITGELSALDPKVIAKIFPAYDSSLLLRKSKKVDIMLGTDYFALHPKHEICSDGSNLSIMDGELGVCLQGSHPSLNADTSIDSNMVRVLKNAQLKVTTKSYLSVTTVKHSLLERSMPAADPLKVQSHLTNAQYCKSQNFIQGEELGTQIVPKCGSCRCSKCPLPGHTYSFQEESELKVIQDNLKYNEELQCWSTRYPWKCDPASLPYNRPAAVATLHRQMKKLDRDENLAKTYGEQIDDMLNRGVARQVSEEEMNTYKGPYYYISHLGVPNPRSKSTPYRIVFNSSQLYKGNSLNNFLLKGPDSYLNNQLGILIRWREEQVAIDGDIKKMYNSVHLELEEQHCHRFLWGKSGSEPQTFCMTRVNMGDKPAGAISTEALYKTADKFASDHPQAAAMLKEGSYVDDLMDSVATKDEALDLSQGAERILKKGGFQVKFWLFSGDHVQDSDGVVQVLGVCWKPQEDVIGFQASLNFSKKKQGVHTEPDLKPEEIIASIPEKLTKRTVLSQMMKIYDPMGLLSPFTLKGKILLRKSWQLKLGWDDALPPDLHTQWTRFFIEIGDISKLWYPRVLKPENSLGKPNLIIFSDASDEAFGFAAYARWPCSDEVYRSRLIFAKSRIAPLTKRTTPQLELSAAVLSKRAREVIMKEMRYDFNTDQTLHIIDSETVLGMLQKTSTRFNIYEGVRIGEIQAATNGDVSSWAWICGENNIADWVTRGKELADLSPSSEWFLGPAYMSKPVEDWELKVGTLAPQQSLPGEKKNVSSHTAQLGNTQSNIIPYQRFSSYRKVVRVLARWVNSLQRKNLKAIAEAPTVSTTEKAEKLIVKDLQKEISEECLKKDRQGRVGGRYYRLKPVQVDGMWVVGTRLQLNPLVPDNAPQYLLPTNHYATKLLMFQAHKDVAHRGRDTTLARFRQKYWIIQGSKISNSVLNNCQLCKLRKPILMTQKMGRLPLERTCPSPAFTHCMVDLFGPFTVRGEVQKRISGKAWGVIFTDLVSRAVFIEGVFDYTTDSFLIALSKFASVRGYPRTMYSDPGSNLTGASKELQDHWESMWKEDNDKIISHSSENGMEWKFSTADSPWQNGAAEAMVKSSKKVLNIVMQNQRLSPSEFVGVLYGVANTINERPIGVMTLDSNLSILTPNSLLLGRSTAKNPGGWYPTTSSLHRFNLVRQIEESFWSSWIKSTAPNLITDAKWHAEGRELQPGDIVLVVDSDSLKSQYKLACVQEVYRSGDGAVRKARVLYKSYRVGDKEVHYRASVGQSVLRPVQKLALVVPANP